MSDKNFGATGDNPTASLGYPPDPADTGSDLGEWQAVLRGEGGSNLAGTGSTSGIPGAVGVVNILGETIGGALRINVSDIA